MKLLILSLLSLMTISSWAQELIHNESTITVQAGAVLYVEGTMLNTSTGVIANSGTIELKGDFTNGNPAGWNSPNPNTLKFSGDLASNVTSNGAQFYNVVVQKGTTFNVNLLDAMSITNNLDFAAPAPGTGNKISLGNNNLTIGSAATVTGFDGDEYVMTGGTGYMKKTLASGTFTFPLGFDAATYNPATMLNVAGGSDTYQARVLASPTNGNGLTGTPITSQVVNAVWDMNEAAAGGNTYDLTLGWTVGDELSGFSQTANAISRNDGVNGWDALHASLGGSGTTRTRTGLNAFGAFAVGGEPIANTLLVDAKVLLQGPFVNPLMVDSLRVHDYIPTNEPYAAAPYNYLHKAYGGGETSTLATFNQPLNGDDIVDWVIVELRSTPTTIVATKSGLLQRDGNIVDADGVSKLGVQGVADGNYYIGVRHRNHLGVRSNATVALSNAPSALVDFTLLATAFDDPAVTKPTDPMKLLTGGLYGLHSGDAGFNGLVSYNGANNDKNVVLTTVGPATPNNAIIGYNRADVNMNGVTLYNGALNDKNVILVNVGPATPNDVLTAHNNN
ncbi:MAG TPA: hypothetical protein VFG10_10095 [Saprospiraceae bacterium]|nr:hypothetical protein [Saprospiraceae bacterium]